MVTIAVIASRLERRWLADWRVVNGAPRRPRRDDGESRENGLTLGDARTTLNERAVAGIRQRRPETPPARVCERRLTWHYVPNVKSLVGSETAFGVSALLRATPTPKRSG